jgi:rieske iron-sulfur protein
MKCRTCSRRAFVRAAATAAVMGGSWPLWTSVQAQSSKVAMGDLLVRNRDTSNTPLKPEDVVAGRPLGGWALDPESRSPRGGLNNRLVLVRLDPGRLSADTRSGAADGVMAYSAICTHSGCTVTDWDEAQQALVCPCHESAFDPYDAGAVLGGPAPRALPRLGLGVNDGHLIVTDLFSSAPGSEPA